MAAPPVIARTVTYHHTRIGRTELDKLLLVVGEGAPAGTVAVKCTVGNAHLQEDTLDDLIAARAALPYVSDRTPWAELTFERDEGAVRYISVEFGDGLVTLAVRSGDPIWTHGQAHRLGEILEEAHGRSPLEYFKLKMVAGLLMVGSTIGLLIFNARVTAMPHNDTAWVVIQTWGFAAFGMCTFVVLMEWVRQRSLRPIFKVTEQVQWGSPWSRLSSGDRIALISVVIAGLTLVATAATLM